jgi:hypothetical protein
MGDGAGAQRSGYISCGIEDPEVRVSRGWALRDLPSYLSCSRDVDVKAAWDRRAGKVRLVQILVRPCAKKFRFKIVRRKKIMASA